MKSILVPLDGSALAERALPHAVEVVRAAGGRLIPLQAACSIDHLLGQEVALDEVAERVRADGVAAEPLVCHRSCDEETGRAIDTAARQQGADLIAMSTHGRGGLGRWLYGSVADQVLREATLPVLLVSPACEDPRPDGRPWRILVTLDGSPLSEEVLGPAGALAGPLGAELLLLRLVEPIPLRARAHAPDLAQAQRRADLADSRAYLDEVAAQLRAAGHTAAVQAAVGSPAGASAAIAREQGADLIAMATHGRGGLARLVLGSVATATLQQASVPLLLVRPAAMRRPETESPASADTSTGARDRPAPPDRGGWEDRPRPLAAGGLTVRDIMTQPAVVAGEDAPLEEIAATMLERRIGCVPIVGREGEPVGIITESDFTGRERCIPFSAFQCPQLFGQWVSADGLEQVYRAARSLPAREIMTSPVVTAAEDEPVGRLVERMIRRDLKRVPVVRDGRVVGVVARHDLLRLMAGHG